MNAIVAGSGLVGGFLLCELTARGHSVTALVRKPLAFQHPNLVERKVDFEHLGAADLPEAGHVYCAVGTTIRKAGSQEAFRRVDYDAPLALARWSLERGAKQFSLVSSVGANSASSNFYLRVKGELEAALRALPFEGLHVFRPGVLLGPRQESRPGEVIGKALSVALGFVLIGGLSKYRAMPADVLARAIANLSASGAHVYHYNEIVKHA
ncbi:MAG: hypothetical protein U0Q16_32940 [Bryobacteraceae bacterium]